MNEFDLALKEIESNPNVSAAVLISAKPNCFIAGADITMLEKCKPPEMPQIFQKMANIFLAKWNEAINRLLQPFRVVVWVVD